MSLNNNNKMFKSIPKSNYKNIRNVLKYVSQLFSDLDYEDICEKLSDTGLELNHREEIDFSKILKKLNKTQCIKLLIKLEKTNEQIYEKTIKKCDILELFEDINLEDIDNIDNIIYEIQDCNRKINDILTEKLNNITFDDDEKTELNEVELKKIKVGDLKTNFNKLIDIYSLNVKSSKINKGSLIKLFVKYFTHKELTNDDIMEEVKEKKKSTKGKKMTRKTSGKKTKEVDEEEVEEEEKPKKVKKSTKKIVEEEVEEEVKPKRKGRKPKKTEEEKPKRRTRKPRKKRVLDESAKELIENMDDSDLDE